ncbi:MAG TPA: P-loop domain-containing protein, partial [Rubrobacteraceae bacterium]|nr:P-loop domain-containing protein [Rubrobacteraceae bacterium]
VSTVVVVGGVGDYLDVADRVLLMEDYEPSDVTPRAREVVREFPPRAPIGEGEMRPPRGRSVRASSIDLRRGRRETARGRGPHTIELGRERVELSYLEQLAEAGQTETIARLIGEFAAAGQSRSVRDVVEEALGSIAEKGLDSLGSYRGRHPGELSLPRAQEVAASINRIRSLEARPEVG